MVYITFIAYLKELEATYQERVVLYDRLDDIEHKQHGLDLSRIS